MINSYTSSRYTISFDTFVLKPLRKDFRLSTRVIERKGELVLPRKPLHIVKTSIAHYGGSFQHAINFSKHTLGGFHKAPIIVAHDFGMPYIFLPTMSPNSELNIWIALHAVENILDDQHGCSVLLENGKRIKVNVSTSTMFRQYAFGHILQKNFMKKQSHLKRFPPYVRYD